MLYCDHTRHALQSFCRRRAGSRSPPSNDSAATAATRRTFPRPFSLFPLLAQVVAATTWDVHRNIQLNERPVTPEQQAALEEYLKQWTEKNRP